MKNRLKTLIITIFLLIASFNTQLIKAEEQFNFDVKDAEITDEGNIFKGLNGSFSTQRI